MFFLSSTAPSVRQSTKLAHSYSSRKVASLVAVKAIQFIDLNDPVAASLVWKKKRGSKKMVVVVVVVVVVASIIERGYEKSR